MDEVLNNLLIADGVTALIIITLSILYLKEWHNDRKGRK